jgi:hypothetical protein
MSTENKIFSWVKQNWLWFALAGFLLTRYYIFLNPPPYVRYFEEYANIWYYGLPPYLKHLFEYPPLTIPFISIPLYLDQWKIGLYRMNFRVMMLIVDALVYGVMLFSLKKFQISSWAKLTGVAFYLVMTVKAKDFMYENLDMLFTLSLLVPAVASVISYRWKNVLQWVFYWFGTGIKLINAPLGLVYFLHSEKKLWQKILLAGITFVLIWGIPLAIFRSSLSVMIVYHKNRGLQVESVPALIARGINIFSKSETIFISEYKSYDIKGPVSDKLLPLSTIALIGSMLFFIWYCWKHREEMENPAFLLKITLIFIFSYLCTNKVFSTPYHLWYLALVAVYPFTTWKERLYFFFCAGIYAGVATTPIPNIEIAGAQFSTWMPVLLQIPTSILLLIGSYRLKVPSENDLFVGMNKGTSFETNRQTTKGMSKNRLRKLA